MPGVLRSQVLDPAQQLGKALGSVDKLLALGFAGLAQQAGFKAELSDVEADARQRVGAVPMGVPSTQPCSCGMWARKAPLRTILFEVEDTTDRSRDLRTEIQVSRTAAGSSRSAELGGFLS